MKRFTSKQVILLLSLWLAFLLSFVTRLSWSTLMSSVNSDLNLNVTQGSSLVSAFYIGYALTVLPGGMISDKFGYKKTILASLAAMALITGAMGLASSYSMLFILRVTLGMVSGPIQSSCLSAIGDVFSENQRGTATGLFLTATSFGITVINSYAPTVAANHGWQAAFLVTAIIPILVMVFCQISLPNKHEKVVEDIDNQPQSNVTTHYTLKESLHLIVKDKNILLLSLAGFFATGATWGVTNWANLFMVNNVGVTEIIAGSIMSLYGIAALISKPVSGVLSDLLPIKKNVTGAILLAFFCPALLLFANTHSQNLLYLSGPILGIGAFMYSPIFNTLGVQAANPKLRATTAGFINLFNQIGSLSAPLILGKVLEFTGQYSTAMMIISIFPIVGALALLLVNVNKKPEI